jgi:hypothetical protein
MTTAIHTTTVVANIETIYYEQQDCSRLAGPYGTNCIATATNVDIDFATNYAVADNYTYPQALGDCASSAAHHGKNLSFATNIAGIDWFYLIYSEDGNTDTLTPWGVLTGWTLFFVTRLHHQGSNRT